MGARWEIAKLQNAMERFWDRFPQERNDFRFFAVSQADQFPENFITRVIEELDISEWSPLVDRGFKMPRIVMRRLVADFADRDEFVCSIYDLEKKIKKNLERKREKKRKKELKRLRSLPPISQLRVGITNFWSSFLLDSTTTLLAYAESKSSSFPVEFMNDFMRRIHKAGWYQDEKDLDYTVPRKVMDRLAATYSQSEDMVEEPFTLRTLLESRVEAEQSREEAYRRRQKMVLREDEEKKANHAKKMEEKAEKEAKKKAKKEKKRVVREKNQMNRLGAKACGLV